MDKIGQSVNHIKLYRKAYVVEVILVYCSSDTQMCICVP